MQYYKKGSLKLKKLSKLSRQTSLLLKEKLLRRYLGRYLLCKFLMEFLQVLKLRSQSL